MKKKKNLLFRFTVALAILLIISIGAIIVFVYKTNQYKNDAIESTYNLESNKRYCLVTTVDVAAGDVIDLDSNLMEQAVYTGLGGEWYITAEELPLKAQVDIPSGTPVMKNMATLESISDDTREYEVSVAHLMTDQTESDCVDIRIMFPNGEDYLVLAKKNIRNLKLSDSIFYITLSEEEIIRLASATIDAYTISGTRLYTTRYVAPAMQAEAIPNYPVRSETIDLLNSDPNILEIAQSTLNLTARLDLENRMSGMSEQQLNAVAAGHGLTDTAQGNVLIGSESEVVDDTQAIFQYDENGDEISAEDTSLDDTNNTTNTATENITEE